MKIILNSVAKGDHGENLPETSLSYESGAVTMVAVETAQRPTVLALLATGRMTPDAGTVTFRVGEDAAGDAAGGDVRDGNDMGAGGDVRDEDGGPHGMARLRAATAIVDAPDVSEPVGELKLKAVVQEELMFAGRPSNRSATLAALDDLGVAGFAGWEIQNVPTAVRLRLLTELASLRPGVEALVLTAPDRRGSDPFEWWDVAADAALRGFAVLVIASPASVDVLAEVSARFEADRLADRERRAAEARAAEAARLADLLADPDPDPASTSTPAPESVSADTQPPSAPTATTKDQA
ncbi:hypothetical protein [Subtercola boreus]|uniref:hypothetical protein n=1 Tax=Subtercola boreus TaxID=120213 RepID=UPI00115138A1|nr:hypothetical protein [Subtercola boreus]TQL55833.1 hypothetical protein FB464_3407 [Subtercola boreus]